MRKLTGKKGVDVVFEHVGADTFNGSLLCLKRGGRLVTCGSTSGPTTTINLMQLFQQQYRIIGSFGASMRNIRESLAKMAGGMLPVIDTEVRARRLRAGPGAAGKPAGVRQDRRSLLMNASRSLDQPAAARFLKSAGDAMLGHAFVGTIKTLRAIDRRRIADVASRRHAHLRPAGSRSISSHATNLVAAFPEKSPDEIETILAGVWDNLGRVAAEFAHIDRLHIVDPDRPGAEDITYSQRTFDLFHQLRLDGKPALLFTSHLANWELLGLCRGGTTSSTLNDPLSPAEHRRDRRGGARSRAPASWARWSRPASMRRSSLRASLEARRPRRHAGRPALRARRRRDVLRPHLQGQSAARATRPAMSTARSTARASSGCRTATAFASISPRRSNRRATPTAASTSPGPCRSSPRWSKAGCASIPSNGCGCTAAGGRQARSQKQSLPSPSCPRLSRASTSSMPRMPQDVDARPSPGMTETATPCKQQAGVRLTARS